jgi:hypothetical protein
LAVDATTTNTASKVVARDASGTFSAGTITAALSGNASTATSAGNLTGGSITGNYIVGNATSPNSYYLQFGDNTGWNYRFMTNVAGTPTTRFTFADNGNFTAVGTISGTNITSGGNVTGSSTSCTGNAATATTASNTNSVSGALGSSFTWTASQLFTGNGNTGSAAGIGMNAYSTGGNGAIMAFHRGGVYAINMGLDSDNVIRIGGWSAAANRLQMDMSGNLTMAGNVTAFSDERKKKNWRPVTENFVEKLADVKVGVYDRVDEEITQVGVSAQSLQEVMPEAVLTDNDGFLSVAYGNAAMTSAVELAKELVALKELVKELKAEVDELKKAK